MSSEPIKQYLAALKVRGQPEAPALLAVAMGADRPSNFIQQYSGFLLEEGNDLTLAIIADEVRKR